MREVTRAGNVSYEVKPMHSVQATRAPGDLELHVYVLHEGAECLFSLLGYH